MKLAFSTNAYLNFSFAEAARRLAHIGYRGVEVMADVPHAWPAFMLPEQKQALRDALDRNGLAISNVNAFMMHAVNDARQRYWHPSWIEPDRHCRARCEAGAAAGRDRPGAARSRPRHRLRGRRRGHPCPACAPALYLGRQKGWTGSA